MNERRMSLGNRVISLVLALVMVIGMVPMSVFAAPATDDTTTETNIGKVANYAQMLLNDNFTKTSSAPSWDTEGKSDTWRYFNGLMVDALLMFGVNSDSDVTSGNGNALEYASAYYDYNVNSSGLITRYNSTDISSQELDSIQPARALFDLLGTTVDQDKYETVLHNMYTELMSFPSYDDQGGNFRHKDSWTEYEIGLDGIYMAQPFLMEYANAIDAGLLSNSNSVTTSTIYTQVYTRMHWVANNMALTDASGNKLLNHGYDKDGTNNVSDAVPGNGVVWTRAVGWYLAALVDVIEMMPDGTEKTALIADLKTLLDGMIAYQDPDSGLWYNVTYATNGSDVKTGSDVSSNNLLETSGTALMAYALLKAYNNGWVTDASYKNAGLSAFNGIIDSKMTGSAGSYTVADIYRSAGVANYSGMTDEYCKSSLYVSDEAKGVGPLIMAAAQASKAIGQTEEYTIGVAAGDLTVSVGTAIENVDVSSVKVTLVSNQGSMKTVDAYGDVAFDLDDTSAAGTTAMTVYAVNGEDYTVVDTLQVKVVDPDAVVGEWVVVDSETVTAGDEYQRMAIGDFPSSTITKFIIGGSSSSGKYTMGLDGTTLREITTKITSSSSVYTFTMDEDGVSAVTHWNIVSTTDGYYICSEDGKYLSADTSSSSATLSVVTAQADATVWTLAKGGASDNFYVTCENENNSAKPCYLNISSSSIGLSTSTKNVYIYGLATEGASTTTPTQWAQLTGKTYNISAGDALTEETIKSQCSIQTSAKEDHSDADSLAWTDSSVSTSWNKTLDTATEGTYVMTVKVNNVAIGTVTVNVGEGSATEPTETTAPAATTTVAPTTTADETETTTYTYDLANISDASIKVGESVAPSFTVTSGGEDVSGYFTMTLTSNNTSVAAIEDNKVVGKAVGTATITVTVAKSASTFAVDSTDETYTTTFDVTVAAADAESVSATGNVTTTETTGGSSTNHTGSTSLEGWVQTVVGSTSAGGNTYVLTATQSNSFFTTSSATSDYGDVSYNDTTYSTAFKFNSSGYITFTTEAAGTLTVVARSTKSATTGLKTGEFSGSGSDVGTISLSANTDTVATFDLAANTTYTLYRKSTEHGIYYVSYAESGSGTSTSNEYAQLSGTATYTITPTTYASVDALLAQIQSDYTIYTNSSASTDGQASVAWTDTNVDYSWSPDMNLSTAGTYVLTVTYKGKTLGTITVAVNTSTEDTTAETKYTGTLTAKPGSLSLTEGGEGAALTAEFTCGEGSTANKPGTVTTAPTVIWDSDNEDIVKVENGVVTIAGAGTANITATVKAGSAITVDGVDGTVDEDIQVTIPVTVSASSTETVTATGVLNMESVTVTKASGADDPTTVDSSLLEGLTMTVSYSNGTADKTVELADLTISNIKTHDTMGNYIDVDYQDDVTGTKVHTYLLVTIEEESTPSTGSIYIHNFTTDGTTSSFYTISGSTGTGSVTYNGIALSKYLKLQSSAGSVTLKPTTAGTLTLVFGAGKPDTVKVGDTTYDVPDDGVLTLVLDAGSYEIVKASGEGNLYYMSFVEDSGTVVYTLSDLTIDPSSIKVGETATVSASGVASDGSTHTYTIVYSVDDTNKATVSGSTITGVAAGEVTVTAKLTHVDGDELTSPAVKTGTLTVNAATVSSGVLNDPTSVTVVQDTNIDLSALSATLTYSDGSTATVNLAQDGFTFQEDGSTVDITAVDATVGTHTITVYYNGVSCGTLTVVVNQQVVATDTVTYELDTDGIDAGAEYIIVDYYSDAPYALGHNASSTTEKAYAVTIDGNKVIIDEDYVDTALWKFEAADTTGYYYISNGGYYIKAGGSSVVNSSKNSVQIIEYALSSGQYRINLGEESKIRDLNLNSTSDWNRADADDTAPVYLYKKVESQTGLTLGSLPMLYIGSTPYQATLADYVTSVKYNGTTYTDYEIEWSSNDTLVAYISDDGTTAVATGKGTTQLVAKLISVGGTDVSSENIVATTDVTVTIPTIDLGDDLNKFVGDSFTITPEVLIGSTVPTYELVWTSSNESVATVDDEGNVSVIGAGTAVITAQIISTNGNDISSFLTISDSVTVNAEAVEIVSGQLSSDTVTVAVGDDAAAVEAALSDITLTLTKNNGQTVEIDHATLFDGVDLSTITTDAEGTHYVNVSYEDPDSDYVFSGTITVKVFDPTMLEAEGFITVETSVTYVIDTDGIDANEEYVIVLQNSDGDWVAMMNPSADASGSTKGSSQVVTRSDDGTTITISENADLVEWLFYNQGSSSTDDYSYVTFNVSNNLRYIKGGGSSILGSSAKTIYTWHNGDTYFIGMDHSSGKARALILDDGEWTRSSSTMYPDASGATYVYLYKRVSVGYDYTVGFEVQPDSKTMAAGTTYTVPSSGITVQIDGNVAATTYEIAWTSSDEDVATVDENGKITAVGEGTCTITATLMTADGHKVTNNETNAQGLPEEIAITVKTDNPTYVVQGSPLLVPLGGEPDFSRISLLIDSSLGSEYDQVIPHDELVIKYIDAVTNGLDTNKPGTYEVDVYHNGVKRGVVVLNVANNPYEGLYEADSYPEYPDAGAVRMNKFATGVNFNETGIAKIELNAAGISTRNAVDVVLIVDVSNSMGWSMDWFSGLTDEEVAAAGEAAKVDTSKDDKLDYAMQAAQDFAAILMANNVSGSSSNNSMTFVTFGGNDTDRGGSDSYVDTVVTAFVGEETLANVNNSFSNTKFTAVNEYKLQIAGTDGNAIVSGTARGNTIYDFAFLEASEAVKALKIAKAGSVEAYDAGDREVHVIFMTDGAPSHYNDRMYGNSNTSGGWFTSYSGEDADWLAFIQNANADATDLYSMVSDFHIVGYDLAHGGFGSHSWEEAQLGRVLGGLVQNKALDYTLATDTDKLNTFFNELGHALAYAGTQALVTDIVSEEFILQTDPIDLDGNGTGTETLAPTIQILERQLVVRTDIGSTLKINGVDTVITEEHLGMYVDGGEDILATVTFDTSDPTDKKAYSSALDEGVDIWDDETNIITGKYFTYSFGTKTFEWNIGNITDKEIALTYYGYLDGALDAKRSSGLYKTNEEATLKYIDTNNEVVIREYPVPQVAWGEAIVAVRFFLVDEEGNFTNLAGNIFTNPANRIFLTNRAYYDYDLNTIGAEDFDHFSAADAFAKAGISGPYALYDDTVEIYVKNSTAGNGEAYKTFSSTGTKTDSLVTFEDMLGDGTYIQTTVYIPVFMTEMAQSDQKMSDSTVVIDYSNSVQWDALSDAERAYDGVVHNGVQYTIELVGFAPYNAGADLKYYIRETNWDDSFDTDYGTYEVVYGGNGAATDEIKFTPKAMLSGTDHVFAVFKFTNQDTNITDETMAYYHMYKQVNVVPATVVHYETTGNMAAAFNSVFNSTAWSVQEITGNAAGNSQSNANADYGYDDSYNNCVNFAGGSSLYVENTDSSAARPSVKFTFTGTGIDIISKTGENQGRIKMTLTGKNTGEKKTVMVLNKGVDNLYQIPVLSVEGLPYDTYEAEIIVYSKTSAYGGQFYFDAVNVYGSAQESEVIGSNTAGDITVGDMYEAAGESSPQIVEIRDILLGNNDFGSISAAGSDVNGAVYIDGNSTLGDTSTNFNNYDKIGPNNEVYLSDNQAVAFKLRVEDLSKLPTTLDIGLKSVNGSAAKAVIYVYKSGETDTAPAEYTVSTATSMFYDILGGEDITTFLGENNEFYVVIANKADGTLSVTDLKVGYGAAKGNVETVVDITVGDLTQETLAASAQVVSVAVANMDAETNTAIAYAMYTTTIVVVTGQDAQSIEIEDSNGNTIAVNASYVDSDNGARRWRVLVRFDEIGTDTYKVYAVGTNGSRHETYQQIAVDVRLFAPATTN